MGANCDSLKNNKCSFDQIEIFLQKSINLKEVSSSDKNISIQYNILEEYNYLKSKAKLKKEILHISRKCKIVSGFCSLYREKEILIKWIKLLYNIENIADFKKKMKQKIPVDEIFQKNLENSFTNDKKFFLKLVAQGLPHHLRQFIWTIIIDKDEKDILNVSNNEKEKIHFQTLLSINKNTKDLEQIEKDVYRTFINEKDKTEKNISILRQLLIALNNLNENIGYCQGINFIVGFILKITKFNKIKAFHLSRLILRKIKGYFSKGFPLLNYNLEKFNKGFTTLFPKLYCHFRDNDMVDELWIGKWIQTLFTINLPYEETCYIWDALLVYGMDFVVPISLSILSFIEKKLLKLNDSSDILSFLQETFNPSANFKKKILYKEDTNIDNYVIPIQSIISQAKKIRNQLNLGPSNGNEYKLRDLLDKRKSFNKFVSNSSIFNFETKMEQLKTLKTEENSLEHKSNPSQSSTDDISSFNKKASNDVINNTINSITNNSVENRRTHKFYTIHHKANNKEEKKNDNKDNNDNDKEDNKNERYLSPNITNNHENKNDNFNFPNNTETKNNNGRNSMKIKYNRNEIKSMTLFPESKNIYNTNKTFTYNKYNTFSIGNESEGINNNGPNIRNHFMNYTNHNNLYNQINNLKYYGNNINNSGIINNINNNFFNSFSYDQDIINNLNLYNNLDKNYCPSPFLTINYNHQIDRRSINTPEVDRIRLKEKFNSTFNGYQNYIDEDTFFKEVNEFYEGEKYTNKVPQFINIKSINGY